MAKTYTARVSFYTLIAAESQEEADKKVNELLDVLGAVDAPLSWDDCEWDYTHCDTP